MADLIEKSVQNEDHNVWFRIKEKTDFKDRLLEAVENKGEEAMYASKLFLSKLRIQMN